MTDLHDTLQSALGGSYQIEGRGSGFPDYAGMALGTPSFGAAVLAL